jgi:GAF domain-containing protein
MSDLEQQLRDARAREAATSEILRVINRSPDDYQPVFDAILEHATRLCDASLGLLFLCEDEGFRYVAGRGVGSELDERLRSDVLPSDPEQSATAKAVAERRPVELLNAADEHAHGAGHSARRLLVELEGVRTLLAVPMLRGDEAVGGIVIYRREVRSFEASHVELLTTFAEQAAIAVDSVRHSRALGEALERQTATSDILRTISRSPTDYGPVFDAILKSSTRLCDAPLAYLLMRKEDHFHYVAHKGGRPEFVEWSIENPVPVDSPLLSSRAAREGVPQQLADITESEVYRDGVPHRVVSADLEGIRSALFVPMMKSEECIGVICLYRREVRSFDEAHVALVSTFGDQAVIAIDNVRLFQALKARTEELGEALERQTATSEILRVISRSPTDYQPVFDTILENATRLCDAPLAVLLMRRDDGYHMVAHAGGARPEYIEFMSENPIPLDPTISVTAQAGAERRPVRIADVTDHPVYRDGQPYRTAVVDVEEIRSGLWVPMIKNDETVGVICLYRREVNPFDASHVELVSTFADQAVIAIDNVRLFQALEARTEELGEALERQTATSDILRTISRSPTDYGPVFDAILESSTRLCDAPLAFLLMREGDHFHLVAHRGSRPEFVEMLTANPVSVDSPLLVARAAAEGAPLTLADITETENYRNRKLAHSVASVELENIRSMLCAPMMKGEESVGVIAIYRREVRPFDEGHLSLVSTFADQAVIAIDNVRSFQALDDRTRELARSVEELSALGEIGQAVNSTLEPETVLTTIINRAIALTGTDGGLISEYDEATGTLQTRAAPGFEVVIEGADPVRFGEGAIGQAAETRVPVQISDIDAPGAYTGRLRAQLDRVGLKALLAVPLLREDRVLGALLVARKTPGEFPPGTVELLGTLAAQSALAIHNARLFREIEEKGRELAQANQHKSEFLANMSHELRTPLNAVIGFSEVLGEEMFGELNEKQAEYVDDIHTSGRHLLSLINDILDLAKVEAGRMELDVTTFAIREALGNALTLVSERAARGGITIESEIDESLADMTGDERKIKQILLNLLSNAVKFTPEGGRVTLTASGTESALVIAVRDTGVGISAEDQERIFEEFRQVGTDYARKVEGTGLGLTLTRRFVELHGGEIVVDSELGAGSEFRITLPFELPVAAAQSS